MNLAGTLFWLGLFITAVLFFVQQMVGNRAVRSSLLAVALFALIATGLVGAAWATFGQG